MASEKQVTRPSKKPKLQKEESPKEDVPIVKTEETEEVPEEKVSEEPSTFPVNPVTFSLLSCTLYLCPDCRKYLAEQRCLQQQDDYYFCVKMCGPCSQFNHRNIQGAHQIYHYPGHHTAPHVANEQHNYSATPSSSQMLTPESHVMLSSPKSNLFNADAQTSLSAARSLKQAAPSKIVSSVPMKRPKVMQIQMNTSHDPSQKLVQVHVKSEEHAGSSKESDCNKEEKPRSGTMTITKRLQIIEFFKLNPKATNRMAAKKFGVSIHQVAYTRQHQEKILRETKDYSNLQFQHPLKPILPKMSANVGIGFRRNPFSAEGERTRVEFLGKRLLPPAGRPLHATPNGTSTTSKVPERNSPAVSARSSIKSGKSQAHQGPSLAKANVTVVRNEAFERLMQAFQAIAPKPSYDTVQASSSIGLATHAILTPPNSTVKPLSKEQCSFRNLVPVGAKKPDSYTVSLRNRDVKMQSTSHVGFNLPTSRGTQMYMGEDAIKLMDIAQQEDWDTDKNPETSEESGFSSSEEWNEHGFKAEDEPAKTRKRGRAKSAKETERYHPPEPTREDAKSAMESLGLSNEKQIKRVLHRLFPPNEEPEGIALKNNYFTKQPLPYLKLNYSRSKQFWSDLSNVADGRTFRVNHWEGALEGRLQTSICRSLSSLMVTQCRTCKDVSELKPLCLFQNVRRLKIDYDRIVTCGFEIAENLERARDLKAGHWIPDPVHSRIKWTPGLATYILKNLKPTFDALLQKERWLLHALAHNKSAILTLMPVYRELVESRELCDICATTVTNLHLFCALCGLIVCPDCVKDRNQSKPKGERRGRWRNHEKLDEFGWPFCPYSLKGEEAEDEEDGFSHYPQDLILASIVPDRSPFILSTFRILEREVAKVMNAAEDSAGKGYMRQGIHEKEKPLVLNETSRFPAPDSDPIRMENTQLSSEIDANCPCDNKEDVSVKKEDPEAISYMCEGNLLLLDNEATKEGSKMRQKSLEAFQEFWTAGRAVIVENCTKVPEYDAELWKPMSLYKQLENTSHENVHGFIFDCKTHKPALDVGLEDFWEGFGDVKKRYVLPNGNVPYLKFKDYPGHTTFRQALPEHFVNFCALLPLPEYSAPQEELDVTKKTTDLQRGCFNLATVLPNNYIVPDLGPKMYTAYGMLQESTKATTNLHLDVSDAVNLMMSVTIPENMSRDYIKSRLLEQVKAAGISGKDYERVKNNWEEAGAIWTIWTPEDTVEIRLWLTEMRDAAENLSEVDAGLRSGFSKMDDPIHDQSLYLTSELQKKLYEDRQIRGCTFVQMLGDAVFIPAGGGHQVQNLLSCIKIAEDFVSPEGVSRCAIVTQEFRDLSREHLNREDKVQLGNIVIHSVRSAVEALQKTALPQKLMASQDVKTESKDEETLKEKSPDKNDVSRIEFKKEV